MALFDRFKKKSKEQTVVTENAELPVENAEAEANEALEADFGVMEPLPESAAEPVSAGTEADAEPPLAEEFVSQTDDSSDEASEQTATVEIAEAAETAVPSSKGLLARFK